MLISVKEVLIMTMVSATELQNNFGKYLQHVIAGNEIIIIKNGKEVARLISNDKSMTYLTDSLVGVLSKEYDEKQMRDEHYNCKENNYENLG